MRRLGLIALALALLAGSCGGDDGGQPGPLSKAEYEKRFRAIVERFEDGPEPKGDEADKLEEGLRRAATVADELDALEPPAEIARAHDDYVAGMRAVADSEHYERVIAALREGDRERANALVDRPPVSPEMIERVGRARAQFAEEGYDLGDVDQIGVGG